MGWGGLKGRRALTSTLLSGILVASPSAQAHETGSTPATQFNLSAVNLTTDGPFKPGDLLTFEVITNLPMSEFHFIQVTGSCLAYPAEWHDGTENAYLNNSKSNLAQAVAVVSSGCLDGIHSVEEVMLVAKDNSFARITSEDFDLPKYSITNGQFVATPPSTKTADSIGLVSIPKAVKLASTGSTKVITIPRLTSKGQTISWTALGSCAIKREHGMSDLGGQVIASKVGKCFLSANTPWGSHLYNSVNIASEVSIYSKNALVCKRSKDNAIVYTEASKCPKGYRIK